MTVALLVMINIWFKNKVKKFQSWWFYENVTWQTQSDKTDLPTVEAVRASLVFSSHPGDGPTHHLLCIGDFKQQGGHGEVERRPRV